MVQRRIKDPTSVSPLPYILGLPFSERAFFKNSPKTGSFAELLSSSKCPIPE
jgi:hypothetical protein